MPTPTKKPKVIIFDVDKTITEETTWYDLGDAIGIDTSEHARLYTAYMAGTMSYDDSRDGLMKLFLENGRKISRKQLENIFYDIRLRPEAIAVIGELQNLGYELCLISSSINMFVEIVSKRLSIADWYANSVFLFDDEDNWINFEYNKEEATLKVRQLDEYLHKKGLSREDCIAVGDGSSDIEIFRAIPGISVHCDNDHLNQLAWKRIKYLPRIPQLLESLGN